MTSAASNSESARITRITRIGMAGNVVLAAIKLAVGFLVGSISLVADGFHSLSDLMTDFAVLIGTTAAVRPADRNHPFGHGKFETFTVVAIAAVLIAVGASLAWKAVSTIGRDVQLVSGAWIMAVALVSIVVKERLYRVTLKVAEGCRSAALRANAWHHRSDALSSVVVLVGGATTALGWGYGDSLAGLLVGLMVLAVGGKLGFEALMELSEGSAGGEIVERIEEVINGFTEVRGSHRLRVRRIGRELMMDIHIVLDSRLTVMEAHNIVIEIESAVQAAIEWPITLTVHVDPDENAKRDG